MAVEELQNAIRAQPFVPFELELSSGEVVRVRRPELILAPPGTRTFVVYTEREVFSLLDLPHVTRPRFGNGRARRRRSR